MLVLPTSVKKTAAGILSKRGSILINAFLALVLAKQDLIPQLLSPTRFTQDIQTKSIHSHNDYWRKVPLLTALAVGCTSTEADLWLIDGTLFVGHTRKSLTSARTFQSLYLDPIMEIINMQNPNSTYVQTDQAANGVFDTEPHQTLQLLVDYKTNGTLLHPAVIAALAPFRDRGLLTTYSSATNTTTWGPLTVIGTGHTPLPLVLAQEPRDVFYDTPLGLVDQASYGPEVAPLASGSFKDLVGGPILSLAVFESLEKKVMTQVQAAHDKGFKVRYWDTPAWPIFQRDRVWQLLLNAGVDFLNADDVDAAAAF
ncbi:hypothetical protein T439DRAFT_361103 [Meredithblackwellia eburnea MCA 4105]